MRGGGGLLGPEFSLARNARCSCGLVATGCEAFGINDLLMNIFFPLQVQHYLKLSQETLYLGISLLDTILDKRDVEADKLQLVGFSSRWDLP